MPALSVSSAVRAWFEPDPDDEVTDQITALAALVTTPIVVVMLDAPLDEVRRMLVELRVPAVAVVDDDDTLRGIITRTDVLRLANEDSTAEDAMSCYVFSLPASAPIERAAALMAFEGVGQVAITADDGALIGLVSALDVARHYAVEAGYLVD
jgi:CBS domain-containing protein